MPFCPFFSTQCPETYEGDAGCAIWTHFGCCMIDKPGIPCIYTDDDGGEHDCFILSITWTGLPLPLDEPRIVRACGEYGNITVSDDLSRFRAHLMHHPNHQV